MKTATLTILAMFAFSANSILCRLALRSATIDATTFSTVRLASGAAMLLVATRLIPRQTSGVPAVGSWLSAGLLFLYAVPFALAYVSLPTGTGALILFGSVQLTMMLTAVVSGERPHVLQWVGLGLALTGLVYLVLPGLEAPSPVAAALMAISGCAWGFYSLRGRSVADPVAQTSSNFVRSLPFAAVASVLAARGLHVEPRGVAMAAASGAITSGLGYVVWYAAIRGMTATRAAVVQLGVPVLTASLGVVLLAETVSSRLVTATPIVLGGIAVALPGRERVA